MHHKIGWITHYRRSDAQEREVNGWAATSIPAVSFSPESRAIPFLARRMCRYCAYNTTWKREEVSLAMMLWKEQSRIVSNKYSPLGMNFPVWAAEKVQEICSLRVQPMNLFIVACLQSILSEGLWICDDQSEWCLFDFDPVIRSPYVRCTMLWRDTIRLIIMNNWI